MESQCGEHLAVNHYVEATAKISKSMRRGVVNHSSPRIIRARKSRDVSLN